MSKSQIKKKWQEQWKRSDEGEHEHCDNDETFKHVFLDRPQYH